MKEKSILSFWKKIEDYMIPTVDNKFEKNIHERTTPSLDSCVTYYKSGKGHTFPWNDPAFSDFYLEDKEYTWEHTVYVGGIDVREIYNLLTKKEQTGQLRSGFYTQLNVDSAGRLYVKKVDRLSCLTDLSHRLGVSISKSTSFYDKLQHLRQDEFIKIQRENLKTQILELKKAIEEESDIQSKEFLSLELMKIETLNKRLMNTTDILTVDDYEDIIDFVLYDIRTLGLKPLWDMKIVSTPILYEFSNKPNANIISSFYVEALKNAVSLAQTNKLPPLMLSYLKTDIRGINVNDDAYYDVRYDKDLCSFKPMNEQQKQLNIALFAPKNHPIASDVVSVNGPPGTGKTTSIQNAISHMIYIHNNIMAKNNFEWNDTIKNALGMFVMSSNNEAVENVLDGFSSSDLYYLSTVAHKNHQNNLVGFALGKYTNTQKWLNTMCSSNSHPGHYQLPIVYSNDFYGFIEYNNYLLSNPDYKGETLFNYLQRVKMLPRDSIKTFLEDKALIIKNMDVKDPALLQEVLYVREAFIAYHADEFLKLITISSDAKDLVYSKELLMLHPVISSTLASADRILTAQNFEYGSIPLIFIDEAAQIPPQHLVLPLLFARRLMVSGDPKQTQRINSSSDDIMHIFYKEMLAENKELGKVLPWFYPANYSAQDIADRVSTLGYETSTGERTGFPLLEHYRCADNLFNFFNHYAYDGRLIYKKQQVPLNNIYKKGSSWINVPFQQPLKAYSRIQPGELQILEQLLNHISDNKFLFKNEKIFIMTMFNDIKSEVYMRFYGLIKRLKNHDIHIEIDTIHGFQGQECHRGYFILGAKDKNDKFGGFLNTPNVLNVAVSRCKNHFYMIGNFQFARQFKGLGFLSKHLDYVEGHELQSSFIGEQYDHNTMSGFNSPS